MQLRSGGGAQSRRSVFFGRHHGRTRRLQTMSFLLLGALNLLPICAQKVSSSPNFFLPGAGGSGPYECLKDWITAFSSKYPEADLSISSVGSGAAISALWGEIDCVNKPVDALCRGSLEESDVGDTVWGIGGGTIGSDEYTTHEDLELQQLPALAGPIMVTYSKDVTGNLGSRSDEGLNMSLGVVAGIFNGSIEMWNDPAIAAINPHMSLPSERITVVVRSDKSGMTETLTKAIKYAAPEWPDDAVGKTPDWDLNLTESTESTAACRTDAACHIKADGQTGIGIALLRIPYSVGYLELGYWSGLTQFVGQAHMSSPAHPHSFVPANVGTLKKTMDGLTDVLDPATLSAQLVEQETPLGGYSISRYVYWYIKKDSAQYSSCYQAWLLYRFVEWSYFDPVAADIALSHGWIIPTASVAAKAMAELGEVRCYDNESGTEVFASQYTPPPYRPPVEQRDPPGKQNLLWLVPAVVVPLLLAGCIGAWVHLEVKKRQADAVWSVEPHELHFEEPPEVVGRGTFGLVLLAEYRGTQVAVKRVIPPRPSAHNGTFSGSAESPLASKAAASASGSDWGVASLGTEGACAPVVAAGEGCEGVLSGSHRVGQTAPSASGSNQSLLKGSLDTLVNGGNGWGWGKKDAYARLKADFVQEMRHLSKLRHPCITTVMGAVIAKGEEPMLVMEYMDHGSLYDMLHNETFPLEGELLLPILRDVARGMRFLHMASPPVIHGDLKAQNVLVDAKFRAKVADFGLSQKKAVGACGTPFWMAPELLRGQSDNSAASDVYSFGIMLFEVYSRQEPYEGEEPAHVLAMVADPAVNKRPPPPPGCPSQVVAIMKDTLQGEPELRPTYEELDKRLKRLDIATAEPAQVALSKQIKKDQQLQSRTTELLFEVFPPHIAEALRDGRKVEPEQREVVTIFFSDIVGFTTISASLPALKVSNMLDRLYSRFDALSREHEVFKVETIGDAYMAVTNLVKEQPDHAKRIAAFAADAVRAANQTEIDPDDPAGGYVNIRVGFHSGPVVANVVGSRNPRYCLFGDTVNTASRMESSSEQNRIHCSARAAALLSKQHPAMPLRSRGKIHIKGKGEMKTFWVNELPDANTFGRAISTDSGAPGLPFVSPSRVASSAGRSRAGASIDAERASAAVDVIVEQPKH